MRLLAGTIPALQKYTHQRKLGKIEDDLLEHFDASLTPEEKETLRRSHRLRDKVLHSDFRAAREQLKRLGFEPTSGGVTKIELPVPTVAEATRKIIAAKEGKEGTPVSDTPSTEVCIWLFEAGASGDLGKASDAFKKAAAIIDRLASDQAEAAIQKVQQRR
jgi:hypothetical protein